MNKLNIRLLYVEDEDRTRKAVSKMLSRWVDELAVAANGSEGLEVCRTFKPHLVLTDIYMPIMNGLEMIAKIKESASPAFVVMSAYSETDYFLKAIDLGVDSFVIKPVLKPKLFSVIEKVANAIGIEQELAKKQAALAESEEKFRRLFEQSNDAIIIHNLDGQITAINRKTQELLGFDEEDIIGVNINRFSYVDSLSDTLFADLKEKGVANIEHSFKGDRGQVVFTEISSAIIDFEWGMVQSIVHNITQRKLYEFELEKYRNHLEELVHKKSAELASTNALMTSIFESPSTISVYSIDRRFTYTALNNVHKKRMKALTGHDVAVGSNVLDAFSLVHEDQWFLANLKRAFSGESFTEDRAFSLNNQVLYYEINFNPIYNEKGRTAGATVFSLDITVRKNAEQKLQENNEYLDKVIQSIPDPFFIKDKQHRFLMVNEAFANFMESRREVIIGKTDYQLFVQAEAREFVEHDVEVLNTGGAVIVESVMSDVHGLPRHIVSKKMMYRTPSNEELIIGIFRDISNRKKAEKDLKESEERFRTLFNTNNDAVFISHMHNGKQSKFIEVNSTACIMLGFTREELMDLDPNDIAVEVGVNRLSNRVAKITEQGSLIYEVDLRSKDGAVIPVEMNSIIFRYQDKESIMSVARNITERKQMQSRILSTIIETEEKERNRFAKDLHDGLGSILSSINIYANMIRAGNMEQDEKDNMFDYMKGLVDEAIMSTREIANNIKPNILSNFGLVKSVEAFAEKLNNSHAIKIVVNADGLNGRLSSNMETILFRVINELTNNTLKHASASNITINLYDEDGMLYLYYEDDGMGFNVKEALVDDNPAKDTGMGLSNIISRIESIHGTCDISSTKGNGVQFDIRVKLTT